MSSQDITRAYKEFLRQEGKRKIAMKNKLTASSTGLLARRNINKPENSSNNSDMDFIQSIVNNLRKQGGKTDG